MTINVSFKPADRKGMVRKARKPEEVVHDFLVGTEGNVP